MKILIYSPPFFPSIGGVETVVLLLADEFLRSGHEVKVVCQTQHDTPDKFPFEVIRFPNAIKLLKLLSWCDIYFQACVNLKGIWPLLLVNKPLIITHQTWYWHPGCSLNLRIRGYIKSVVTYFSKNIAISRPIAKRLYGRSVIIPNPYNDKCFFHLEDINRDQELVYVGRLIPSKGVDLLISALSKLRQNHHLTPKLTVIGEGSEASSLKQLVDRLNLQDQVGFVGSKKGTELVKILNQHKIIVIPSRWAEPFGIVALEGIACGCVPIGSENGGLKDAIGPCGLTFPNEDVDRLVDCIHTLLTNESTMETLKKQSISHLKYHTISVVADAYLKVLSDAIGV